VKIAGRVNNPGVVAGRGFLLQELEHPLHDVGVVPAQTEHLGEVDVANA
jgi:hypothetical protein